MTGTAFLGTLMAFTALAAICVLAWWSFRTINRISRKHLQTVRDIVRELSNGR